MTTRTATFQVPALHCEGCVDTVEAVLGQIGGVLEATADLDSKTVMVVYDPSMTAEEGIIALLESVGYPPTPSQPP